MNKKNIFSIFESPYREYAVLVMVMAAFALDMLIPDRHFLLIGASFLGALPTAWQAWRATMERRISINTFNFIALIASFTAVEIQSAAFIVLMITSADLLEWYSESRTFDAVRQLLKLKPLSALRERAGVIEEIPSDEIRQGDVVVVKNGARVPIDGTVVFGSASVNEAPVTGESVPVRKITGDQVFTGTLNDSGILKVRATKVGKDSIIEQMAALIREASKNKSKAEKLADRFASIFLPVVLLIGGLTYFITRNISMTAAIFLVACADDMAVAVPLAITASMGRAASRGVIVKGGVWLDKLGKVKMLVLDKTGTLTYGSFEIREARIEPGVSEKDFWNYLGVAEKFSEHPVGRAIFREALSRNPDISDPEESVTLKGSGIKAVLNGKSLVVGTEDLFRSENIAISEKIRHDLPEMLGQYGQTVSLVAFDGRFIGMVAVADIPRAEAAKTMAELKKIGVNKIIMFTGDNEAVAKRISVALGLDSYRAAMKPEDKLRGLEELEKQGVVVMVGDGINDAPSLARASVGIAMGKGGTAVAVEAADIVILTDELSRLPEMIELGRRTSSVIYGDMVIWLLSNVIGFALVLTGVAGPAMAAFYNFITDFFPLANSSRLFRSKIKINCHSKYSMEYPNRGLNPKIEVRITPNKGRGLFAKEKIFKGEIIEDDKEALKDTQILTKIEIAGKKDSELWKSLCYEISSTEEVCPRDIYNPPAGFLINHSCDPNVGVGENMIALRNIEADEEITYDYSMTDAGDYDDECLCGSVKCRGRRRGTDWMIPEIQERYKGYFQENIQKKIDFLNRKSDLSK